MEMTRKEIIVHEHEPRTTASSGKAVLDLAAAAAA
jgi:hypothetical protein